MEVFQNICWLDMSHKNQTMFQNAKSKHIEAMFIQLLYIYILVGGLEHFVFFHILGMSIPTDELIYLHQKNQRLCNHHPDQPVKICPIRYQRSHTFSLRNICCHAQHVLGDMTSPWRRLLQVPSHRGHGVTLVPWKVWMWWDIHDLYSLVVTGTWLLMVNSDPLYVYMTNGWLIDFIFPFSWECHHPSWRTHIFLRGIGQPPTSYRLYRVLRKHRTTTFLVDVASWVKKIRLSDI